MWRRVLLVIIVGGGATVVGAYTVARGQAGTEGDRAFIVTLVAGLAATVLVTALVWQSGRAAARATADAEMMLATLREREHQLLQSNRELERFATIAAHDLQEPLRTILTFSNLIERKFAEELPGEALGYLLRVAAAADRMRTLIEDLLVYARIGQAERVFESVDLRDCVEEAIANVEQAIEETGARVDVGDLPVVDGNPQALTQLFTNLLSNALKYRLGNPPQVRIGSRRQDNDWVVSVADNGKGIDPANHAKIFELFRRLEPRDGATGTGLGLAICARVVDAHGGSIWVSSKVGGGATFSFTLPVRPADATGRRSG